MIGETVLHYKIIEKLGEGGMGIVYLAEDTKLKRQVAIKFLPPQMATSEEERERFKIEAQAAAALNHSNITQIYAIEESDDDIFIVMELVRGKELKEEVRSRKWEVAEVVQIASQIAKGLQAAHKKDIVHRDIKTSNIMITDSGQVKIMDFGLAKIGAGAQMTKDHTTLGTTAYMSPEQTKGESVDKRTDIWSFGVLLYEMLTGSQPFKGDYEQAIIYSILNEAPHPVTEHSSDIPLELADVVKRCLQKEPSNRYQDATELLEDLNGHISASDDPNKATNKIKANDRKSLLKIGFGIIVILLAGYLILDISLKENLVEENILVVMPFENLGSADEDYFTEGMTEEITSRLSTIKKLGVISRKSALAYRNTNKTTKQIGEELGANYVLEGSVRWARSADGKERVRITPQLIKVQNDIQVWTKVYEHTIEDIFQVQSEIAHNVVDELGIRLADADTQELNKIPTDNIEAYHLFLRGKYYLAQPHFTRENWNKGIESFQHAVELDPKFALAYAELSKAHSRLYYVREDLTPERLEKANFAARKAEQLDKDSPYVHLNLGYYYLWAHRETDKALEEFDIAEKGLPNNVDILKAKSELYETKGMWQEKIRIDERSSKLNPRDPSALTNLAFGYWFARQYEQALKTSRRAIEVAPEKIWPYLYVAQVHMSYNGPNAESRSVLKNVPSDHSFWLWNWYWQEVGERKFDNAFRLLYISDGDWMMNKLYVRPKSLLRAIIYKYQDKSEMAIAAFDSARIIIEEEIKRNMDDPRYHSSLGVAYAGLGRKEEAIREGKKAVELLPFEKDAVYSTMYLIDLAAIYSMSGEYELALEKIQFLLSIPSCVSEAWLRMDIRFAPLYNHPDFLKLTDKYAQN